MSFILCSIILLISTIFIPNVQAISYYSSVETVVYFEESIDVEGISSIDLALDINDTTKYYELSKSADFKMNLGINSIPIGSIRFDSAIVDDDYTGIYRIDGNVIVDESNNTVLIELNVCLQNNQKHSISSTEVINNVKNGITTTTATNNISSTNISTTSTSNSEVIIDNSETTTSIVTENTLDEQETEENNRKKIIYIIVYSTIGIIVLVLIFIAFVNIKKANK